ncbi:hypothetical protein KZ483_11685 [Paenibacillus sp. sptzw28]|uniref:VOC family protein n=1 Tax=Paenibacillus sp. sptzw28 TaxID=715179 RepID=UPI001C6E934E|nr:VOC family protein [Paenibacillus sp. sptzw28]QYR23509.1 hypothetical protein KZ483_11685 [Paenibacillus sp. sptzw28]
MGRMVSFELSSQNPDLAAKFYSSVFGWKVGEPNWGYHPVITGTESAGIDGGISVGPTDFPHGTRITIEVDDIDAAIENAKQNGANVLRPKMDFAEFYLAYMIDPVGIGFGLIQPKKIDTPNM